MFDCHLTDQLHRLHSVALLARAQEAAFVDAPEKTQESLTLAIHQQLRERNTFHPQCRFDLLAAHCRAAFPAYDVNAASSEPLLSSLSLEEKNQV